MRKAVGSLWLVLVAGSCADYADFHWAAVAAGGQGGTGGAATTCTPGEKRECYTGPEATKGQGICRAGEETCLKDGSGFGSCDGEVLPGKEDCATPIDEDCDGLAPSCEGLCLWSKAFGDDKAQSGRVVAVDPAGSLIVAGPFSGEIDLGGGALLGAGGMGTFIAKISAVDGGHAWSKGFGAGVQSFASAVVDTGGNVTVAGTFGGTVDFGGGPVDGGASSTFVVQLDPSGDHRWSHVFKGGLQDPEGVAADTNGNVLVVGSFLGSTDFGAGAVSAQPGGSDVFVVSLSAADGAYQWSKTFGDGADQVGSRVLVDPADGNVVLAGIFDGEIDLGSGTLVNQQPGQDAFVAKLDVVTGDPLWVRQFQGNNSQAVLGLSADSQGGLVLAGTFFGTADFGGGTEVTSAGGADIFVTKLALVDGGFLWSRIFGQEGDQTVRGVASDGMGNVVLAGPLSDETDFGGGPLPGAGLDVYVVKVSAADGKHVWSKRFGDPADQAAYSVAADARGEVFLTGFFKSTIDFGCGKLTSAGDADVFLTKLSP